MKKFYVVILEICFLCVCIGLLIVVIIDQNLTNKINEELKNEKQELMKDVSYLEGRLEESKVYNKFLSAVDEVESIPYTQDVNCYGQSQLLQQKLRDEGIESSIMITEWRTHAWVAVWIEATTGRFIKPDNSYKIIEVRDSELNVICD